MRRSTRRPVPVLLALLLLTLCVGALIFQGAVSLSTPDGPTPPATSNSAAPGSPSPAYTSLTGTLTFSPALGEAPVVEVEAIPDTHPDSPLRVTSGPGGRFAMDALAVGECYTVRVADAKRNAVSTTPVTVNANAGEAANVVLHVVGAAAVSGRVDCVRHVVRPEVLAGFPEDLIEEYKWASDQKGTVTTKSVGVDAVAAAYEKLETEELFPVAGVTITLKADDPKFDRQVTTDAEGNYLCDMLIPGGYEVAVIVPDDALHATDQEWFHALELGEFSKREDLEFRIECDTFRVNCLVTDATGAAVANAHLELIAQHGLDSWQLPSEFSGTTDDLGQFTFAPLPIERMDGVSADLYAESGGFRTYRLIVRAEGFADAFMMIPSGVRSQLEKLPDYLRLTLTEKHYPGAREVVKERLAHFVDESTLRAEIVLQRPGSISGSVVDGGGNNVAAVRVWAETDFYAMGTQFGEMFGTEVETVADAQGHFFLNGLPKGDYTLNVRDSPLTKEPTKLKLQLDTEEKLEGVVVVVPAASDLWHVRGKVIDQLTREPILGGDFSIHSQQRQRSEGDLRVYDSEARDYADNTFDWVGSGSGDVKVRFGAYTYANTEFVLEVTPGKMIEREVELAKPGTIRAKVTRDGEAVDDAWVCAYAADDAKAIDLCRHSADRGENGVFYWYPLSAGTYLVEASMCTSAEETSFVRVQRTVTVRSEGDTEVELDYTGSSRLFGVYAAGDSMAFVRELVLRQSGAGGPPGTVRRQGVVAASRVSYPHRYDFAGVPPGSYRLELLTANVGTKPELEITSRLLGTVILADGETREFNLGNLGNLE